MSRGLGDVYKRQTNKVILVGNPMHHPRIKEMYMGQLRDCNNKSEVEGDE